ncbi:helix-turn-helix transcriptional regulator [Cellulomonas composti]|uniref:Transcriptional regulator n=1 Tax=Cellulomonas composti TaxID=266130 RepID=A0A511J8T2_9CELL|nr:LuxR family transcriptional regulator [Cellulomonas composti]GEL94404.1 transcriptional regulator [Cellulomonas composti]
MPPPEPFAGPDLLERDDALAELRGLLARAVAGEGRAVRVLGPPGAGKTALLRTLVATARERGVEVLSASAGVLDSRTPYGVVHHLFDLAARALPPEQRAAVGDGPARLALEHVLGAEHGPVDPGDLLASLYRLLEALSAGRPAIVVVDDAQWADEESLLFLASLRERLRDLPVLAVVAVRDVGTQDRGHVLAALVADPDAHVLRLTPLSNHAVGRLLERTWGEPVGTDVAAAAAAATDGNPFLLLALARLLPAGERSAAHVREAVPGTVVDAVAARLSALTPAQRALATAIAVLDAAPLHVAAQLAGLDPHDAAAAADVLRDVGLTADAPTLTFRHALLRSAALAATGHDTRARLHREAARLLAGDPHHAAAHLLVTDGTGDPWAVDLLATAAQTALDDGAPHSAVALLRRAVAEPADDDRLPRLLLRLGLAELRAADRACLTTLLRAHALVTAPEDRARAAIALAEAYGFAGRHEDAAEVLARTFDAVRGTASELDVEAALVASSLLVPTRIADARRRLAARPDLAGATRAERHFLIQQMADAAGTNQPADVIRAYAHRALHPEDTPETTDWVWARLFLSAIGDHAEVRRLTDVGFAQVARRGSVVGYVTVSFMRGLDESWGGSLVAAEGHLRAMLEHSAGLEPGGMVQTLACSNLAQVLALQGRAEQGLELLAPFPEELGPVGPAGVAAMSFARATVRQALGDHAGALHAAQAAGELVRTLDVDSPTWAAWRAYAVEPLRSLGRLDEARALAAEHVALCERSEVPQLLAEALRLAGRVAPTPAGSIALLTRSVDVAARSESRLQEAASSAALGAALRRAGSRSQARPHLLTAHAFALEVGALPLAAEAEAELAAAGSRVRPVDLSGVGSLTVSERRVAELAASGLPDVEIARRLFVARRTVETHLSHAYRKLGVTGRDGLAGALAEHSGRMAP